MALILFYLMKATLSPRRRATPCSPQGRVRVRVAEQAHRHDLAVRERAAQLIGRALESDPVRTRAIQVNRVLVRTLAVHDII